MIRIFSSDRKGKVEFKTREPGRVYMYVCGPTVYDSCHVGHARPAVVFDTVRRYLEYSGYAVTFISNITDIDDKIINRAAEVGLSCAALAGRYQDEYEADMTALGVRSPTIRPRATEHIAEMLELIAALQVAGAAYVSGRGVWFDVSKFPAYGKLSGRSADDENTEHRVEQDPEKRNPQDFALWKFSKPGEPEWDSPWGKGRPGWHIECSAMSGKYCGMHLDIHGGGADLQFPHHENEIAQSEACLLARGDAEPFANYWMHNGFITVAKDDGAESKMGKSKGNAFWLRQAFKSASPAALRLWILGTHYRAPLLYKPELLVSAASSLDRIYTCLEALLRLIDDAHGEILKQGRGGDAKLAGELARATYTPGKLAGQIAEADAAFRAAMDDDFNTPQALAAVYDLIGKANVAAGQGLSSVDAYSALLLLQTHLSVLGLPLQRPETGGRGADGFVKLLVDLRTAARKEKNFALSDRVRDGLAALGVELNDRDGETTWKLG